MESQERQVRALEAAIALQKEQLRITAQIQEARSRILLRNEKIGQNKVQMQQNTAAIRQAGQVLIDKGYIEKLQAICPSVPREKIEAKFIACWNDPAIKGIEAYNVALAKALEIIVEQIEKVNAELGVDVFATEEKARGSRLEGNEKLEKESQTLEAENKSDSELVEQLEARSEVIQVLKEDVMQVVATQTNQPIESVIAQVKEAVLLEGATVEKSPAQLQEAVPVEVTAEALPVQPIEVVASEKVVEKVPNKADELSRKLLEVKGTLAAEQKDLEKINEAIGRVTQEKEKIEKTLEAVDLGKISLEPEEQRALEEENASKESELKVLNEKCKELEPQIKQHKLDVEGLTAEIASLPKPPPLSPWVVGKTPAQLEADAVWATLAIPEPEAVPEPEEEEEDEDIHTPEMMAKIPGAQQLPPSPPEVVTPVQGTPPAVPVAAVTPPPAGPQATDAASKIKAAANLLTLERACAILDCKAPDATATPEAKKTAIEPMIKACMSAGQGVTDHIKLFEGKLQAVSGGGSPLLAGSMNQEFRSMMAELKKPLPSIPDLDFTNPVLAKQKIAESADKTLPSWEEYAKKSGIDPETKSKEVLEAQQEFEELRKAIIDLRVKQYAIGATAGMDIEAKDANSSKEWEAKINRLRDDQYYKDVAAMGTPADENYSKDLRKRSKTQGVEEYLRQLESEAKKVPGAEGLYVKVDEHGNELYIVKTITPYNIQRVIDAKKAQKQINWNNVPKEDMPLIENQCLANWKKVTFEGNPLTALSELMPERKGDWKGWIKAINEKEGMGWLGRNQLMKRLVRDVVGNDPKRLKEFMLDLRSAPPEDRAAAMKCLTDQQRGVLQKDALDRLAKLENDKIELAKEKPEPADMPAKLARLNAEIANTKKELEMFAEADPKMAVKILAEVPSIGEHYIARLDQLETELENAEKLKESGEAEQSVADAEVGVDAELASVETLATPKPTPVQPQPTPTPPQQRLAECLIEQKKLSAEIKRLKYAEQDIDTPAVTKLMESVATAAGLIPDGPERAAAEKLVAADKKLLKAEKELKVVRDDPAKLKAELSAAQKGLHRAAQTSPGLLQKFGTNPELLRKFWANCGVPKPDPNAPVDKRHPEVVAAASRLLDSDKKEGEPKPQQDALQAEYYTLLRELSKGLKQAKEGTGAVRVEFDEGLKAIKLSHPKPSLLGDYIEAQENLAAKQKELEDLEIALREREIELAQEEQKQEPDEAEVNRLKKVIEETKEKIEQAPNIIAGLKAKVIEAKKLVQDHKNPNAEEETKVVKGIEKLAQGLLGKREKQEKIAGELAAAERQLGELVGSTNMPTDVAKTVKTALLNVSSLVMVMKCAQNTSDTLHPKAAAEKRKEEQAAAHPGQKHTM